MLIINDPMENMEHIIAAMISAINTASINLIATVQYLQSYDAKSIRNVCLL